MLRVAIGCALLVATLAVSAPAQAVSPATVEAALGALMIETALLQDTIPKARFEGLIKQLLKAIENTTLGAAECAAKQETKADNRYRYTRGWLLKYIQTLDSVGMVPGALADDAAAIIEKVDALIAIKCAGDEPAPTGSDTVLGLGGKPR